MPRVSDVAGLGHSLQSALLTSSQMMLMLMLSVQCPQLGNQVSYGNRKGVLYHTLDSMSGISYQLDRVLLLVTCMWHPLPHIMGIMTRFHIHVELEIYMCMNQISSLHIPLPF